MAVAPAADEARMLEARRLNDALIDPDLIRKWLLWGFFWLLFAPTIGVLVSNTFNYPEILGSPGQRSVGSGRCTSTA
jgi:hypothetical protein